MSASGCSPASGSDRAICVPMRARNTGQASSARDTGPAGIGLATVPLARPFLIAMIVIGSAFMAGAFAPRGYWASPPGLFVTEARPAVGLERITRHPFFSGVALVMGSHALLATHLTGTLFFGGFLLLIAIGPRHQARKFRGRHGASFDEYQRTTSAIPFIAILRGRQRIVVSELPWISLALGALLA